MDAMIVKAMVRKRDGYRCTVCGMTNDEHRRQHAGKALHVHRRAQGEPYTVDGCVTVCYACHGKQHRKHATWVRVPLTHVASELMRSLRASAGRSEAEVIEAALVALANQEGLS